jgi:enoyl-CoA hydratase
MQYQTVSYEQIGAVARICHNRPEKRNAQSTQLLDELDAALTCAAEDKSVRVIILGGKGKHFSAGHDVRDLGDDYVTIPTEERYAYEEKRYYGYALRLWDIPKPTIAQVQGACVVGAFMVAAMCDLLVASEDAFFSDHVVAMGGAACEVLCHPWVLGHRLAKDMLYTGRRITAAEAKAIGFANRVVPREDLERATLELANQIAKAPPFALKMTKKSINRTLDIQGFRAALDAHFDTHELSHTSAETLAGAGGTGEDRLTTLKAGVARS